jgi:hypothetical protein
MAAKTPGGANGSAFSGIFIGTETGTAFSAIGTAVSARLRLISVNDRTSLSRSFLSTTHHLLSRWNRSNHDNSIAEENNE